MHLIPTHRLGVMRELFASFHKERHDALLDNRNGQRRNLFVTQRHHWIHFRSPPRRNETSQQRRPD